MKLSIFGVPLDPLECPEYVEVKRMFMLGRMTGEIAEPGYLDPYDALLPRFTNEFGASNLRVLGKLHVDSWLTPKPEPTPENHELVTLPNYEAFTDLNGLGEFAKKTMDFLLERKDAQGFPLLTLGVDHSSTLGIVASLLKMVEGGRDELCLVVLDHHSDLRSQAMNQGLLDWEFEQKGSKLRLNTRPDTLNAGNHLLHLLRSKAIRTESVVLIGVADYPSEKLKKVKDPRVQNYVETVQSYEDAGMKIIPNVLVKKKGVKEAISPALGNLQGANLYVSFDSDVGILSSIHAARLMNFSASEIVSPGLSSSEIFEIAGLLAKKVRREGRKVLGLDLMETDVYRISAPLPRAGQKDGTMEVETRFAEILLRESSDTLNSFHAP